MLKLIQEYLFMGKETRDAVEKYKPENVDIEIFDINNTDCWCATYSVRGENETGAKTLSKINEHIISNFHPTILANGCSAYYNKKLFPYINEFERKLRKLLYLKSALSKNPKDGETIKDLESKDLGEIFTLLFTDVNFVQVTKKLSMIKHGNLQRKKY